LDDAHDVAVVIRTLAATVALTAGLAAQATAAPLPLAAYWPMGEGHGQVVHDISGHGNNGVLGTSAAAESSDPSWIRGGVLGALHFGGHQSVGIPDTASLRPERLTVMALVRGSVSPGTWRYVVAKGALGCTTGSYGLYTGFGGGMAFYIYDGIHFRVSPEASKSIWNGRWHAFAGTYDGLRTRLFVDGHQVGTGTAVPPPGRVAYGLPIGAAQIGGYAGCSLNFTGDIDEASVWSSALHMPQIKTMQRVLLRFAARPPRAHGDSPALPALARLSLSVGR
jgi:hypothetical protein